MGAYTKNGTKVGTLNAMSYITIDEARFLVDADQCQDDEIKLSLIDGSVFRFPYPTEEQSVSRVSVLESLIGERYDSTPEDFYTFPISGNDPLSCCRCCNGNAVAIVGEVVEGSTRCTVIACTGCGEKRKLNLVAAYALIMAIAGKFVREMKDFPMRVDHLHQVMIDLVQGIQPISEHQADFDVERNKFIASFAQCKRAV